MEKIELLKSVGRKISINSEITEKTSKKVNDLLMKYDLESTEPILLHINTVGGNTFDTMSIIGVMKIIDSPVFTYVSGIAFSAGAFLLASGSKGFRFANKGSKIMIHNAFTDVNLDNLGKDVKKKSDKYISDSTNDIIDILSSTTGQKKSFIRSKMEKETYFNASEGLKYGFVDAII